LKGIISCEHQAKTKQVYYGTALQADLSKIRVLPLLSNKKVAKNLQKPKT
jgi:hypothetical protein